VLSGGWRHVEIMRHAAGSRQREDPMRMILAGLLLLSGGPAFAQVFCVAPPSPTPVCNGCDVTLPWKVVASTVPRPTIPGLPKDRPWCVRSFGAFGGVYRAPEIVQRPALGEARVLGNTRIAYRSARPGRDRLIVRWHWMSHLNQPQQGRIIYDIEVLDRPI
jgi:hypothetical protein